MLIPMGHPVPHHLLSQPIGIGTSATIAGYVYGSQVGVGEVGEVIAIAAIAYGLRG